MLQSVFMTLNHIDIGVMHACMLRTTFTRHGLFPEGSTMIVQAILILSKYRFNIKVKTALLRDFQFH